MGFAEKLKDIENELKGLSKEEQEKRVRELLSNLSEEELDELKKQQCLFCMISDGKIESFDVYEDDLVKAVLDIKPANKGHVLLFPKDHYAVMTFMDEKLIAHIFKVANMLSKAVFEGVKAQGTNIYIANGRAAGQAVQHVVIHIIPRFEDDGVGLSWSGKNVENEEMKAVWKEIKSKIVMRKEPERKEVKIESVSVGRKGIP